MADNITRDELTQLRTALRAQHATTSALQARLARVERRRLPRRFLPLAVVALLVALLPLSLLAATPFDDLTGGVHDPNIEAIYNAGITTGCVPNESYCPTDTVTRQEMASFLARTAGLGTNPPVANAKTAQTVPDGSVTAAKLSGAGSQPGQALVSTGAGVAWQAAAGPQGLQGPAGSAGPAGPSFGASVYLASANLPTCTETAIATLPITVATPARLQVTGTVSFQGNGVGGGYVSMRLRLRNQANTVTLATTGKLEVTNTSNLYDGIPLAAGGVLHTLEAPYYPGDERPTMTAHVAPTGTYLAQLLVHTGGSCSGSAFVQGVTLTALHLGTAP